MKYVAFIDTLGFKEKITNIPHEQAVEVIRNFNQTVFNLWQELNLKNDNKIKGRTFSDSIIIHSLGESNEELQKILNFLIHLYRRSVTMCDLPLRGGLAFGEYDDIRAVEFENLRKGLIVGTAFIDAYLLESSNYIKGSKLIFGQNVNLKIERELHGIQTQKIKTTKDGKTLYELKWGDIIYLTERNYETLNKLIDLATKSNWNDHYFGTIETFLIKESNENKFEIFSRIIDRLKNKYRYSDLDNFIENYLKSESAHYTKRSFLSFIRNKI